jgi:hypothetical protein
MALKYNYVMNETLVQTENKTYKLIIITFLTTPINFFIYGTAVCALFHCSSKEIGLMTKNYSFVDLFLKD